MERVFEAFRTTPSISFTDRYEKSPESVLDLRRVPPALPEEKRKGGEKAPIDITGPYPQVFDDRGGFGPNLCAIDLLFNLGPQGVERLYKAGST